MAGDLQPLDEKFPIVDQFGKPTLYFIKWCQSRQIDITEAITLFGLEEYLIGHQLQEGDGIALTPDGNLTNSPSISVRNGTGLNFDGMQNLKIADTAVTPGTYGDATHVGQFTVDQQGRLTAAANVAISAGGGGGNVLLPFPTSGLAPGVAGTNITVPVIAVTSAFAHNNSTITNIYLPVVGNVAGNVARPVIYGGTDPTAATPAATGAALVASGNTVVTVANTIHKCPLTTPLAVVAGRWYWVGFAFTGGAGNLTLEAMGSNMRRWFNAGTHTPAPAVLPAMTADVVNATPFWVD
jgi:hypothetical protein